MRGLNGFTLICCSLIALITLCPLQSNADRSELSWGLHLGSLIGLSRSSLNAEHETFRSIDPNSFSEAVSLTRNSPSLYARVGLGMSFSTTAWFNFGVQLRQQNFEPVKGTYLCQDPKREETLNQGGSLLKGDRCIKQELEYLQANPLISMGFSYKPWDDLSPIFEVGMGVLYRPERSIWFSLVPISSQDSDSLQNSSNLGELIEVPKALIPSAQLSLGIEKRVKSRWGLRMALTLQGELNELNLAREFEFTALFSFSVTHYTYIRLL